MASKYTNSYAKVAELERSDRDVENRAGFEALDLNAIPPIGRRAQFVARLTRAALRLLALPLLRTFFPVKRLLGLVWVTRHDDVVAVLKDHDAFPVPFGREMKALTGGENFALGDDGALHARQRRALVEVWKTYNVDAEVLQPARRAALAILDDAGGEINVIKDLFTRVAAETCLSLFGLAVQSADEFADASMAGTALLFADPWGDEATRRQALIGSRKLRHVLDANYDQIARGQGPAKGLLPDLINLARSKPGSIGDPEKGEEGIKGEIRAMLFGMITGFVPTNTMSAGHILEELAGKPKLFAKACGLARAAEESLQALAKARAAAGTGQASSSNLAGLEDAHARNNKALQDFLFEVARFNPALFPGQFRIRSSAESPGLATSPRLAAIRPGEVIMASTASALMDGRVYSHPLTFDPERFAQQTAPRDLMFGIGLHNCLGEDLAKAIITETFQILLSRTNLRFADRRPKLVRAGPFPRHLAMTFDVASGHRSQTMISSVLPLRVEAREAATQFLRGIGIRDLSGARVPADKATLPDALERTGIVHFSSINVIELGSEAKPEPVLLFEFNVDGSAEAAIESIFGARGIGESLAPLLDWIDPGKVGGSASRLPASAAAGAKLGAMVLGGILKFHTRPWGATGLTFSGTSEFPVAQIEAENRLYDFVQERMAALRNDSGAYLSDAEMVARIREQVRAEASLAPLLLRPSARFPAFSRWTDFEFYEFVRKYLTSRPYLYLYGTFLIATIAVPLGMYFLFLAPILPTYVTVWVTPIALLTTVAIGTLSYLRYHELVLEKPHDELATHEHMQSLQRNEDLPGYSQNHLTSVSEMKPGLFRKLTMAFALYAVKKEVELWFRPGYIIDFGTIHYARWFTIPGSGKLIFQSNFDGSWESYLEDFITKVHAGQTAAWNNAVGFPQTNWFVGDGAKDGDRFKRWVRRQQVETLFWFSRFPTLTTDSIRKNALVREGLAKARTAAEFRAWIDLFGAAPRTADTIEADQIQSIAFGNLGSHGHAVLHAIRFEDAEKARLWVGTLVTGSVNADDPKKSEGAVPAALTFGDANPAIGAKFIAFSARGLDKLGVPDHGILNGRATFPTAFLDGMANRSKILGDLGADDRPEMWTWSDAPTGSPNDGLQQDISCDAALFVYEQTAQALAENTAVLAATAAQHGLALIRSIDISLPAGRTDHREPFGFRDGIAQPVMRGTRQFAKGGAPTDDIVGAGEFILGYKDSRGYYPPTPTVLETSDVRSDLPPILGAMPDRIPQFSHETMSELRDFGRNGSFLAIRQLRQDVPAFKEFVARQTKAFQDGKYLPGSEKIRNTQLYTSFSRDPAFSTQPAAHAAHLDISSQEWVAAKMMGRWQDGSSLSRHPVVSHTHQMRNAFLTRLGESLDRAATMDSEIDAYKERLEREGVVGAIWDDGRWADFLSDLRVFARTKPKLAVPFGLLYRIEPDNDFHHGLDDPQGLNCPIASHIRKANPRDSFRPGSPLQIEINNRHRLLRRGRTFNDAGAVGTLFVCLNANLERQFEFVQQTWINSRNFHDQRHAPDPIVSPKQPRDQFAIPTADQNYVLNFEKDKGGGPVSNFVTMVGGGYFFLPSRQALMYLSRERKAV